MYLHSLKSNEYVATLTHYHQIGNLKNQQETSVLLLNCNAFTLQLVQQRYYYTSYSRQKEDA